MNGSIELNSELGVGSTFKIILSLSQNKKREVVEISPKLHLLTKLVLRNSPQYTLLQSKY
jgi:hypothetical protein